MGQSTGLGGVLERMPIAGFSSLPEVVQVRDYVLGEWIALAASASGVSAPIQARGIGLAGAVLVIDD